MKKYMPYVIIGIPALIGILFLVKSMRKKSDGAEAQPTPTPDQPPKKDGDSGATPQPTEKLPLKRGSRGKSVEDVQRRLGGLTIDGIFGRLTEAKVKAFQKANSLTSDGIVGSKTWKAIFGVDFPKTGAGGNLGGLPNKPYATTKFPVDNSQLGL
jgi:peptidoglycan hydrolase-like protein with peptidoglycan-binding domain